MMLDPTMIGLMATGLGFGILLLTVLGLCILGYISKNESKKCRLCQKAIDELNEQHAIKLPLRLLGNTIDIPDNIATCELTGSVKPKKKVTKSNRKTK